MMTEAASQFNKYDIYHNFRHLDQILREGEFSPAMSLILDINKSLSSETGFSHTEEIFTANFYSEI